MSKNFAYSTVASPAPGASGVSLTVRSGHGSRFYVGKATVFPAGSTPSPDNAEVLSVTAVNGDTLTVTRAVESSSARTIGVGDVVVQGVTASMWDDLVALVATKASASLDADGTLTVNGTTVEVATDAQLAALSGTYARRVALWATGNDYLVDELVINSGTLYRCTTAHTAGGSFAAGNFSSVGGGGGGGATVTLDADGTLVVDGLTVEVATDAEVEAATNTTTHQALGSGSGTRAISTSGKWVSATLTGNTTFTFPTPPSGRAYTFTVEVIQDATGGRTVTWPASVLWPGGSAPVVGSAANAVSLFQFTSRDAGTTWYGSPQSVAPAVNGTPETVNVQATGGASQAIPDPTVATLSLITLTAASCALTFPSPAAGKSFSLVLKQDATGGRLVTWPTITWVGTSSVAPTLSTSGNKQDAFTFMCLDGSTWLGFYGGAS